MNLGLNDRVAIVTGASRGIGRACAAELLAEGAHVVVASNDVERNREACRALGGKGGRVLGIPFDIESDDSVRAMVERAVAEFGRLDILVNNAGAYFDRGHSAVEPDLAMAERSLDVNLLGPWRMCRAFIPLMRRHGYGRLATRFVEVCGNSDHGFRYGGTQIVFSSALHFLKNHRRDFLRCIQPVAYTNPNGIVVTRFDLVRNHLLFA